MKAYKRMEREIANLTEEDCKKLFPNEYYTKYAAHLKILQFQNSLLDQLEATKPKQTFIQRKKSVPLFKTERTPLKSKTKLNKNDFVADTIANNKEQVQRMTSFVKNLNLKLQEGPSKSAKNIRTPLTGFEAVPEQVFRKMRFIQNDEYSIVLNRLQQKKKKQSQYMHFRPRSLNHSISASKFQGRMNKSIIAQSIESQSIKEFNPLRLHQNAKDKQSMILRDDYKQGSKSISYSEKMQQLVAQARSQIITINPEDKHCSVQFIMTLNKSIKKMNNLKDDLINERRRLVNSFGGSKYGQKNFKSTNRVQVEQGKRRKNLIEMTGNVRRYGQGIEVQSRYDNLMRERKVKQFLKNK